MNSMANPSLLEQEVTKSSAENSDREKENINVKEFMAASIERQRITLESMGPEEPQITRPFHSNYSVSPILAPIYFVRDYAEVLGSQIVKGIRRIYSK